MSNQITRFFESFFNCLSTFGQINVEENDWTGNTFSMCNSDSIWTDSDTSYIFSMDTPNESQTSEHIEIAINNIPNSTFSPNYLAMNSAVSPDSSINSPNISDDDFELLDIPIHL